MSRGDRSRLNRGGPNFCAAGAITPGALHGGSGALRKGHSAPAERYGRALHKEYSAMPERSTFGGALRKD